MASSRTSYNSVLESPGVIEKGLHHAAQKKIERHEPRMKYFCTHCPKNFTREYHWKAHELRCHERQTQYTCPKCNKASFSETSFKAHLREAHGNKRYPRVESAAGNVEASKRRTAWGCGICSALLLDWEKRCNHVAAHCEAGSSREDWNHSKVIIGLLRQPVFDCAWRSYLIERHGNYPDSAFGVRWRKAATGRSSNDDRQLQDWLEMGHSNRDVDFIINLAYKHGHRSVGDQSTSANTGDRSIKKISVWKRDGVYDKYSVPQLSNNVNERSNSQPNSEPHEFGSEDEIDDSETTCSSSESEPFALDGPDATLPHVIGPIKQKLVDDLMCEFRSLLDQTPGCIERGGNAEGSESRSALPPVPKAAQTSSTLARKRQRRFSGESSHPEDSGNDGNDGPNKPSNTMAKDAQELGPRFACPYYQRNPQKHRSRSCAGPGWITVHRVK